MSREIIFPYYSTKFSPARAVEVNGAEVHVTKVIDGVLDARKRSGMHWRGAHRERTNRAGPAFRSEDYFKGCQFLSLPVLESQAGMFIHHCASANAVPMLMRT